MYVDCTLSYQGVCSSASIDDDGTDNLGKSDTERLWRAMARWHAALNSLSEQFSGELLLDRQEQLDQLQSTVAAWSNLILCVMRRHPDRKEADDPDQAHVPTSDSHKIMLSVNSRIDSFMKGVTARTCGENGGPCSLLLVVIHRTFFCLTMHPLTTACILRHRNPPVIREVINVQKRSIELNIELKKLN